MTISALRLLSLIGGSGLAVSLAAADWYVAPTGNDSAVGSMAEPLATLSVAVGKTAANDRILLQRGGTYRITTALTISTGRTLTAYGTGDSPVVTASSAVTLNGTWATNAAVRTATLPSIATACWVAGAFVPVARTPNSGWFQTGSSTTQNQITGAPTHAAGAWNGAQVRWRRWSWWWEYRPITTDDGAGNLSLGGTATESGIDGSVGSSYIVDGFLGALDAPAEWYADASTLYLYPPTGSGSTAQVDVLTNDVSLQAEGAVIDGITFSRFGTTALTLNNSATTVKNCTFSEIGNTGISLTWNAGGSLIQDNVFTTIHNNAISWIGGGAAGGIIERNVFTMIGMQPGYGGQGTWHSNGIVLIVGNGVVVRLNRFVDIGYCGIIVGNDGQTVDRNYFRRCLRTLNDGGAIYTNCSYTTISNNIVLDSIGDTETSMPWFPLGQGIWPEFIGPPYHDTTIQGNTVTGCNGNGLFMSNHATSVISGNTILDNRLNSFYGSDVGGHTFTNNLFGNPVTTRRTTAPENLWYPNSVQIPLAMQTQRGVDYGSMSGTHLIGTGTVLRTFKSGQTDADYTSVATWAAAEPTWADSGATLNGGDAILLINDRDTSASIDVPPVGTWTTLTGASVSGPQTVAPFSNVVLLSAITVSGVSPYYLASAGAGGHETIVGSRSLGRFPGGDAPSQGDLTPVALIFAGGGGTTSGGSTSGGSTSGGSTSGGSTSGGTTSSSGTTSATGTTTTSGTSSTTSTSSSATTTSSTNSGSTASDSSGGGGGGCGFGSALALCGIGVILMVARRSSTNGL